MNEGTLGEPLWRIHRTKESAGHPKMATLKIAATGDSAAAQAQARGKLFEQLMAEVLRELGYSVDRFPRVNYAGMEIDVEGHQVVSGIPLYAECKCYETPVGAPQLQGFFGKYMAKWLEDKRSQGIFIALPGVTGPAKGFYRQHCERNQSVVVCLFEEEKVLELLLKAKRVLSAAEVSRLVPAAAGEAGDTSLLATDNGVYWLQHIVPPGAGIPNAIAVYDANGVHISDKRTLDVLATLEPDLRDLRVLLPESMAASAVPVGDPEEVVEVRGSAECFEYQFPASAEHFVGRQTVLDDANAFWERVLTRTTSSRGILVEANSGWGKSSLVLALAAGLRYCGHSAIAIDSRTASSSQFITQVLGFVFKQVAACGDPVLAKAASEKITGFDGAVSRLLEVGREFEKRGRLLVIFLDQFENVFFLPDCLKRIRDLLYRISDSETNVVLGFSWKTDLVSLTSEFPYRLRDGIHDASCSLHLHRFSEVETTGLLNRLSQELHASLRKDLRFFLSEFSQGYPWLLKRLCAHVKAQREAGGRQLEIAKGLLNAEELFKQDLRGLSDKEEEALRRIARAAPMSFRELGEEYEEAVIQSLVNRRLIIRVGTKYDVYWDIFRDYLNTGTLPAQENYILRAQVGSVLKAVRLLVGSGGQLSRARFRQDAGLVERSFYNVIRDMSLLGLAKVDGNTVGLGVALPVSVKEAEAALREHLRERLCRNRLVCRILEALAETPSMELALVAEVLKASCPYVTASHSTWLIYARIFSGWIDAADLAVFDGAAGVLARPRPGMEIRDRALLTRSRRRGGAPRIQYRPIEEMALRIYQAILNSAPVDYSGMKSSTMTKALGCLHDLGFIEQRKGSLTVFPQLLQFAGAQDRQQLFAAAALRIQSFKVFVDILNDHQAAKWSLRGLGWNLRERLRADWCEGTSITVAKIMLDWARNAGLAPSIFAKKARGHTYPRNPAKPSQPALFSDRPK